MSETLERIQDAQNGKEDGKSDINSKSGDSQNRNTRSPEGETKFNVDEEVLLALDRVDITSPSGKLASPSLGTNHNSSSAGIQSDSDSETEDDEALNGDSIGYRPLPQDPDEFQASDSEEEEGFVVVPRPQIVSGESEEHVCATETATAVAASEPLAPDLKEDEIKTIKEAMVGFSLPVSSVPEWARHVPEDVWKTELIQRLHTTTPVNKKC